MSEVKRGVVQRSHCFVCKAKGCRLYKLPSENERLEEWMKILKRTDLLKVDYTYLKTNARICCDHFSDWAFNSTTKLRLIKYALPLTEQAPSLGLFPSQEQPPRPNNNGVAKILTKGKDVQMFIQNIDEAPKTLKVSDELKKAITSNVQKMIQNSQKVGHTVINNNKVVVLPPKIHKLEDTLKTGPKVIKILIKGSNKPTPPPPPPPQSSEEAQETPQKDNKGQAASKDKVTEEPVSKSPNKKKTPQKDNGVQKTTPQKRKLLKPPPKKSKKAKLISDSEDEVQLAPESGDEVQKTPESGDEVQKTPESGDEVQKTPESGDEVQKTPESGDEVQKTPESGDEAQPASPKVDEPKKPAAPVLTKRERLRKFRAQLKRRKEERRRAEEEQEENKIKLDEYLKRRTEVMQEENRNKLEQYLKNRKAVLQKLQSTGVGLKNVKKLIPPKKVRYPIKLKPRPIHEVQAMQFVASSYAKEDEEGAYRPPSQAEREQRLIRNQRSTISKLKKRIEKLSTQKTKFIKDVKHMMNDEQYGFVMSQIQQCKRGKEGRRWTEKDKTFGLRIYLQSPDAYRILLEKLSFPSIPTLRKYARRLGLS